MAALEANLTMAGAILIIGLAFVMTFIGGLSYARTKAPRMLWIGLAFFVCLMQGVYLTMQAFEQRADVGELRVFVALNLAIVSLLYVAVLRP